MPRDLCMVLANPGGIDGTLISLRTGDLIAPLCGTWLQNFSGSDTIKGPDGTGYVDKELMLVLGFSAPDAEGDCWPLVYCLDTQRIGRCWINDAAAVLLASAVQ